MYADLMPGADALGGEWNSLVGSPGRARKILAVARAQALEHENQPAVDEIDRALADAVPHLLDGREWLSNAGPVRVSIFSDRSVYAVIAEDTGTKTRVFPSLTDAERTYPVRAPIAPKPQSAPIPPSQGFGTIADAFAQVAGRNGHNPGNTSRSR